MVATHRTAALSAVLAAAAVLLSSGTALAASGNGPSTDAAISGDGRFVAFSSEASDLVAGDTNGVSDVFVRDRSQGTTERVSIASDGAQADGPSRLAAISANGRFVLMWSGADNLAAGDTNRRGDIFLRDRTAGTTERVSVGSGGVQADDDSAAEAAVSDDGRVVAFESTATNLAAGPMTPGVSRVYVHDRVAGTTELAGPGAEPALSTDGRYLAFAAANGRILVRDHILGTTEEASVASDGTQLPGKGAKPTMSADGRFVEFLMVEKPPTGSQIVTLYVRDRLQHTTQRFQTWPGDPTLFGNPSISADGTLIAYTTFDSSSGVFVRGTGGGAPELASITSDGVPGNGGSLTGSGPLSADGRFVAFFSGASNLAPGDANSLYDVYVRDRRAGTTELVSVALTPGGAAPSTPQTPVTPAPAAKPTPAKGGAARFATLVLEALKPVILHSHKPSLHVSVTASTATTITLTLRDRNGRKLASWQKHAKAGKNAYTFLLPPTARKPGHETLQVAAAGNPAGRALGLTLKA